MTAPATITFEELIRQALSGKSTNASKGAKRRQRKANKKATATTQLQAMLDELEKEARREKAYYASYKPVSVSMIMHMTTCACNAQYPHPEPAQATLRYEKKGSTTGEIWEVPITPQLIPPKLPRHITWLHHRAGSCHQCLSQLPVPSDREFDPLSASFFDFLRTGVQLELPLFHPELVPDNQTIGDIFS